jgi:DeoR/GlpR family transcriptional regulator of sugar metabolism
MSTHQHETSSPDSRRAQIIELIELEGEQHVERLAARFGVSGMTIRRDLQELADEGRVVRTYGGATVAPRVSFEFRFLERADQQRTQKQAIGQVAAELVKPGESVLLDSGTTTLEVARRLRRLKDVTVLTNSLPIASELFGADNVLTFLIGGQLRADRQGFIGALTDQVLDTLRTDWAFLGADSVDAEGNAYVGSVDVGRLMARMAQCASRVYAVVDHTKIGHTKLMRFANLREWSGLITDAGIDPAMRRSLEGAGVQVLVGAGPAPPDGERGED